MKTSLADKSRAYGIALTDRVKPAARERKPSGSCAFGGSGLDHAWSERTQSLGAAEARANSRSRGAVRNCVHGAESLLAQGRHEVLG
jgi:hypothetical protein